MKVHEKMKKKMMKNTPNQQIKKKRMKVDDNKCTKSG